MINCQRLNKHIVTVLKEHLAAPVKHLPVRMDGPQSSTTTWLLSWQKQASWMISTSQRIESHGCWSWSTNSSPGVSSIFNILVKCHLLLRYCYAERSEISKEKKIELVSYGNNMKRRSNEDGLLLPIQTTYGANWMKIKCVYIHLYVLPLFHNKCLSFVKI